MENINSITSLQEAIRELEIRQAEEERQMKHQFNLAYESIKPVNLILSTFKEAAESQDLKNNVINTSVGLVAGYVSKTVFEGVTDSPLKKLFGSAIMFGITNIITKNPQAVKALGQGVLKMVRISRNGVEQEINQTEEL